MAEPPANSTSLPPLAIVCRGVDRTGVLYEMTSVIVRHGGYIHSVDILERGDRSAIFWELYGVDDEDALIGDLERLDVVHSVERVPSMLEVFGKRIIVIGGGAQVGQVALGAIAEADRHNIRGEKISVDTIPIVGEENLANAVRAVPRLPRAVALVLAGALMGGEITKAVKEVRAKGVLVVSLNMAGSAPSAADLVVSDPVQAGVMTVMAVAKTARFDIARQRGRVYLILPQRGPIPELMASTRRQACVFLNVAVWESVDQYQRALAGVGDPWTKLWREFIEVSSILWTLSA